MKEKIEASLRRAAEQLPQPDFNAVADTPVQPLEVHDYVTRQEPLPRRRPFRPAAAALALCVLALCVGLWSYFQFFQVYSVVDLRVNPAFAIELDRRDQVKGVNALNEDAQPILEGRSYRGWSLEATVEALLDDLWAGGYLDDSAQVDVAVNSKSADHGRVLREEVEALIDAKLSSLTEGVEEDPETVLPTATIPADTPSAATTPAVTTPAVTTPPPAATPAVTAPAVTTPPPATTPAVTAPAVTTPPVSDPPAASGQVLGWDQVQAIVTGRLPDAVFEEIQLDEDDGRLLYEVKFWDAAGEEYEAELDAFTGEILKWERD